jgi:hypothetical protein
MKRIRGKYNEFQKAFIVPLIIFLAACSPDQIQTVAPSPAEFATSTEAIMTPSLTKTSRPTKTPTPTFPPTMTIPAGTLNAVSTVEAIRTHLVGQFPELEEFISSCHLASCYGVDVSPDGKWIYFSNGNVIELLEVNGKKLGQYSWYEIYGESHGYPDDYYEGYVTVVHWSKDGQYLYLATQHGDGGPGPYFGYKSTLARINLQNGTWKDTGISGVLSFSRNDKYIIYTTNTSEIRVRELQSGEERIYVTPAYYQYFGEFVWSPDNKKVILVATPNDFSDVTNKFALFMIDLENDKIILLYEDLNPFYYPVEWVEDNKVSLNKYQKDGTWIFDLSANPPTIHP